jgi:predicted dehydrogenase
MRKIRMGMVGGGENAFIGPVHRIAAALDGRIELVCGAFSRDPENSKISGRKLCLPDDRVYSSYQEMFEKEAALPADQRMEFVAIVTPNDTHYPVAKEALCKGFHVMSDKPATMNLQQAIDLRELQQQTGLLYGLTHTYTGYPMVKEARHRIQAGELGKIRKILVEYPQGWLSADDSANDNKQAEWRVDPARAGISCCMGDIGTHAKNLAEYISGLSIDEVYADLSTFVEGRLLDDDGSVLLHFEEGAKGVLTASQICAGEENALTIRIYGEKGGMEWSQQEPNTLFLKWLDRPTEILRAGTGWLSDVAMAHTRTPGGHPEGYLEAFANIYRNFANAVYQYQDDIPADNDYCDYPGIDEGIRTMAFVEAVVDSSKNQRWVKMADLIGEH